MLTTLLIGEKIMQSHRLKIKGSVVVAGHSLLPQLLKAFGQLALSNWLTFLNNSWLIVQLEDHMDLMDVMGDRWMGPLAMLLIMDYAVMLHILTLQEPLKHQDRVRSVDQLLLFQIVLMFNLMIKYH